MASCCSTRIHCQEWKKHDYLMVPDSSWHHSNESTGGTCLHSNDNLRFRVNLVAMCVSIVFILWDISRWFFLIPLCLDVQEFMRVLDCWMVVARHRFCWTIHQWAMGFLAHGFLVLATDRVFFGETCCSFPPDSTPFPAFPHLFSAQSVESGAQKEKQVTSVSKSSVFHLNLWLLKNSRAKIWTLLFSCYSLTTSPKAMVTHV